MFLTLKEKTVRTHYDFIIYPSLMALFNRLIHVIVPRHILGWTRGLRRQPKTHFEVDAVSMVAMAECGVMAAATAAGCGVMVSNDT